MSGKFILIGLLVSTVFITGCASDTNKLDKASKMFINAVDSQIPGTNLVIEHVVKARVPMASTERNALAKTFVVNPDKANIYIYRNEGTFGAAIKFDLEIDGKLIGKTAGSTFAAVEIEPGKHTIMGKAENDSALEIVAQAGKNYFIRQELSFGFITARNKLQLVEEEQGKDGVFECGLIEVPQQYQQTVIQHNFASPDKIIAPSPIAGNRGKYKSPFTAKGMVALWAQKAADEADNESTAGADVGSAVGQQVADSALAFVPLGLGSMVGRSAGEAAGRAATHKNIDSELPSMAAVTSSSDISFNSVEDLAVYMYVKNSNHRQYAKVLALTQRVYPELQDAYTPAIEKASALTQKKEKSADKSVDAPKKL